MAIKFEPTKTDSKLSYSFATLSSHVKLFLAALTLVAMCVGIAGIWGYAGSETVGKALGTMAVIGVAVFVVDGVIYGNKVT